MEGRGGEESGLITTSELLGVGVQFARGFTAQGPRVGLDAHWKAMILLTLVTHFFNDYCSLLFRFVVEAVREAPIDPRVRHLILRRLVRNPLQ